LEETPNDNGSSNESLPCKEDARSRTIRDIPEQPPRIARYLRTLADDTFDTSIAYTEQELGGGDRTLRGAYYGFGYDGEYKRGYFKIDTRSGESSLLLPIEIEYGEEADFFDDAFWACRSFWKPSPDSELPELSSVGISVLDDYAELYNDDGEDMIIFHDHWFDHYALRNISADWDLYASF
jgi:hypothetical protein